jgi:hypothetical protein
MLSTILGALSLISMTVLPGATYQTYSYTAPDALPGVAFVGGWATRADVGPDQLYWTRAGEVVPHPLVWSVPPVSQHVNDPTVIAGPGGRLWMYFTELPNADATADEMDLKNSISLAVSDDGGATWAEEGVVVPDGWSPAAIENSDGGKALLWHTNSSDPQVQIGLIGDNGALLFWFTLPEIHAVNVSVAQLGDGSYLLVGNGIGPLPFYDIVAYRSTDLVHWRPFQASGPILVNAGSAQLLTPEVKSLANGHISLTFTEEVSAQETVTMRWEIAL